MENNSPTFIYDNSPMPNNPDITVIDQIGVNTECLAIQMVINDDYLKRFKFLKRMVLLQGIVITLLVIGIIF